MVVWAEPLTTALFLNTDWVLGEYPLPAVMERRQELEHIKCSTLNTGGTCSKGELLLQPTVCALLVQLASSLKVMQQRPYSR